MICPLNELLMYVLGVKDLYCNERTYDDETVSRRKVEILNVKNCHFSTVEKEAGCLQNYKIIFTSLWYGTLFLHLFAEDHRCYCIVLEGTTPADDIDTENGTGNTNDGENKIVDHTYTKM